MIAQDRDLVGGVSVSRETMTALEAFAAEVRRWTTTVNLVARGGVEDLWGRHVVDSAQVFAACPADARLWVDLGSGGGFPGVVVALLAREHRPNLRVTLIESDQRKAAFLRQVTRTLGLEAQVLASRVEAVPPQSADVVSARALAPLSELLGLAAPHLKPSGVALFLKGARHAEEVAAARTAWMFDLDSLPSVTHPDSALLIIRKIRREHRD